MKRKEVEPLAKALLSTLNQDVIDYIKTNTKLKFTQGKRYYDVMTSFSIGNNLYFQGKKVTSMMIRDDFEVLLIDGHKFYKEEMK